MAMERERREDYAAALVVGSYWRRVVTAIAHLVPVFAFSAQ